jgi:hypothetical protein
MFLPGRILPAQHPGDGAAIAPELFPCRRSPSWPQTFFYFSETLLPRDALHSARRFGKIAGERCAPHRQFGTFNLTSRASAFRRSTQRQSLPPPEPGGTRSQRRVPSAPNIQEVRPVAELITFPAHSANPASLRERLLELARKRLQPIAEVIGSGSKVFHTNPILFSLWLLLPLSFALSSDWIGLLVVFQAMTAAVRLHNAPAANALASCSSTTRPAHTVEGECRVL